MIGRYRPSGMDDTDRDLDERPMPVSDHLDDLISLTRAQDAEALWRALVLPIGQATTDHWFAVHLFRRHHADGTPGGLTTASLLCTDCRWDACTARLIAGIEAASILDDSELDELAGRFLWSDRHRFEYPASWIGLEWVEIPPGRSRSRPAILRVDPDTPVPTERRIPPPLRRWAAARILRADPGRFEAILRRASELGGRDGGAAIAGVLDAVGVLDADTTQRAIDAGLGWPIGAVRLVALDVLAATHPDAAARRAAADPDAKVRRWRPDRERRTGRAGGRPRASQEIRAPQPGLFPEGE